MYRELYEELSNIILNRDEFLSMIPEEEQALYERMAALPAIEHVDLWHDQVDYLSEEHPFPTPAVFFGFQTLNVADNGELMQTTDLQVDIYVFWETFADTYNDAVMKEEALMYLDLLLMVGLMFHGRSGEHFHQMRRSGTYRQESGGSGNLYRMQFQTNISEFSGLNLHTYVKDEGKEVEVVWNNSMRPDNGPKMFDL
jgi:hypothetical protein